MVPKMDADGIALSKALPRQLLDACNVETQCRLMTQLLSSVKWPLCTSRQNVRGPDMKVMHAFACGLGKRFSDEQLIVTRHSREVPDVVSACCAWMRITNPDFEFTSIQFNCDYAAVEHRDQRNFKNTQSYCVSLGQFEGGTLSSRNNDGRWQEVPCKHRLVAFQGQALHRVSPFKGKRYSLVFFCSGDMEDMLKACETESRRFLFFDLAGKLLGHGFNLPDTILRNLQAVGSTSIDDNSAKDGEEDAQDLREVFQEFNQRLYLVWYQRLHGRSLQSLRNWRYVKKFLESGNKEETMLHFDCEMRQLEAFKQDVYKLMNARDKVLHLRAEQMRSKRRRTEKESSGIRAQLSIILHDIDPQAVSEVLVAHLKRNKASPVDS